MIKQTTQIFLITIILAVLSAMIKSDAAWWLVLKYASLALCFFTSGYWVSTLFHLPQIQSSILSKCVGCIGLFGILFFIFLTMDTFVFHVWSWYPGMFRYVLFDAYGICYSVFFIFGVLFYLGSKDASGVSKE